MPLHAGQLTLPTAARTCLLAGGRQPLNLTAVRPVAFFSWNAQSFLERWMRRGTMGVLAIARSLFILANRVFATRVLHAVLRGESRDRLDLLGDEFFQYFLKPRLKRQAWKNSRAGPLRHRYRAGQPGT